MRKGKDKGQAAAELALLLPLLLLILLGCLDVGRAFSVWLTLTNGAREGARYGASFPVNSIDANVGNIENRTRVDILSEGLSADALQVDVSIPERGGNGLPRWGSPVVVRATYVLPMTTLYLFGGSPLTISASAQMSILDGGS